METIEAIKSRRSIRKFKEDKIPHEIVEKASNVEISEINGNCPQHITMIGMFGDVAAVNEAINAIRMWEKDDTKK